MGFKFLVSKMRIKYLPRGLLCRLRCILIIFRSGWQIFISSSLVSPNLASEAQGRARGSSVRGVRVRRTRTRRTRAQTHTHTRTRAQAHTRTHTDAHVHKHTRTRAQAHTRTHTHKRKHTHAHRHARLPSRLEEGRRQESQGPPPAARPAVTGVVGSATGASATGSACTR